MLSEIYTILDLDSTVDSRSRSTGCKNGRSSATANRSFSYQSRESTFKGYSLKPFKIISPLDPILSAVVQVQMPPKMVTELINIPVCMHTVYVVNMEKNPRMNIN